MYTVAFRTKKIDKKVLRAVKALKSTDGHTLQEAEQILKDIHAIVKSSVKIPYKLVDTDNEIEYVFDDIIIDANNSIPKLMNIMEDEIIASGHEDSQQIINSLERQYQAELDELEDGEQLEDEVKVESKKKKKGLNVLGLIKKDKKQNCKDSKTKLEDDNTIIGDFEELEEIEVQNSRDVSDCDFQEVNEEVCDDEQEETSIVGIEDMTEDDEILPFQYDDDEINNELSEVKENNATVIVDEFPIESSVTDDNIKEEQNCQKKNEKVIFPQYDLYLDLSSVNNAIERSKQRFENSHLVKLLGLKALSSDTISELDTMKLNYALNSLEESKFVLLKDYLYNSIENIKDKTQTQLAQAYEKAMALDYEEEANKNIEDDVKELYNETENVFEKYRLDQEEEYNLKLSKFEYEQEKSLEEFKKQQGIEKSIFLQDLDTKKSSRISLYKDNMQNDINIKKEQLIDLKMYELKNISINQLTETKRRIIRNFEEQLDLAVDDIWDNTQAAINDLKDDIENHIPVWKNEIEEKRRIEYEKKEELRKQEELNIQKQQIEIERKKLELEMDSEKFKDEDSNHISEIIEKKFAEYDEKINTHLVLKSKEDDEHVNGSKNMNKKNRAIIIGFTVATLVVGSAFVGVFIASNRIKPVAVQQSDDIKYYELSKAISNLEEKLGGQGKQDHEKEDIDTLLEQKKYERAMTLYKDDESVKKIENTLYANSDLAMLITFNKTNKTIFGPLDEAILSKDADKVLEIYKSMPDDIKEKHLDEERKHDIAVFFYQKGENETANKLVGLNSK